MEEILLIIFFVFVVVGLAILAYLSRGSSAWKKTALTKLAELEPQINSENLGQMKHAVSEADKILGFALKSKNIKGETLGERLKNAKKYYDRATYQDLWNGHKVRNRLAHEMDFNPKPQELKDAFRKIKKGIRSL